MSVVSLDATHDPSRQSWVGAAQDPNTDFPLQNLPFGRFRLAGDTTWRVGVAIGDQVLDVKAAGLAQSDDMAQVLALTPIQRQALRHQLFEGLSVGSAQQTQWQAHLHPQAQVQLGLPCEVRDYTDFYIGIHHATAVGKLFRPDQPLLPNYRWVPIGYHGRASSIVASGTPVVRPQGQLKAPDAQVPRLAPSQRLDFELELGVVIGPGNVQGQPVPLDEAEAHVFGLTLFNDWSARDIQAWEYQPLGPFLSKNFASTQSPWMVTLEALAPFRLPFARDPQDIQPLPYLSSAANAQAGAFDIQLAIHLQTQAMREAGHAGDCISRSHFAQAAYWTVAQLVTHHTVGGCNLGPGDLLATGTLSGPEPEQAASMLELSQGGKQAITLSNGEQRSFLLDGDEVTLQAHCQREGLRRIGFGSCTGRVLPAVNI